jgi:hypothetical protein
MPGGVEQVITVAWRLEAQGRTPKVTDVQVQQESLVMRGADQLRAIYIRNNRDAEALIRVLRQLIRDRLQQLIESPAPRQSTPGRFP